jgi:outer membrane protein TolC
LELPAVAGPIIYNTRLANVAVKNEPRLRMMQKEVARAQAMAEQTRRMRYPDVAAGVETRAYSGTGEHRQTMFMFSMSIPWGNSKKYDADLKRDQLRSKAAALEASDREREIRDEVFRITVQVDASRREALLYRDQIIPRTEVSQESARIAWEANRGTFRDLLDTHRMLLDAQLMYARAIAEQYQMMADLILCCGLGDMEALQMIGAGPETSTQAK